MQLFCQWEGISKQDVELPQYIEKTLNSFVSKKRIASEEHPRMLAERFIVKTIFMNLQGGNFELEWILEKNIWEHWTFSFPFTWVDYASIWGEPRKNTSRDECPITWWFCASYKALKYFRKNWSNNCFSPIWSQKQTLGPLSAFFRTALYSEQLIKMRHLLGFIFQEPNILIQETHEHLKLPAL